MSTSTTQTRTTDRTGAAAGVPAGARRAYAILIGLTTLFVFVQFFTSGEFVDNGSKAAEAWQTVHGLLAYPVMLAALGAAVVAFARLRRVGALWLWTGLLFVLTVAQWLLGHAISTLGMDWVIPIHVVLVGVLYALAIWLSVRSALLRRATA